MMPQFRKGILSTKLFASDTVRRRRSRVVFLCFANHYYSCSGTKRTQRQQNTHQRAANNVCFLARIAKAVLRSNFILQVRIESVGQPSGALTYIVSLVCRAYKDYDGNPTDVCVQMDVDEFFNMLCEKVEDGLKNTNNEKVYVHESMGNRKPSDTPSYIADV